jgi:hypothetical protein
MFLRTIGYSIQLVTHERALHPPDVAWFLLYLTLSLCFPKISHLPQEFRLQGLPFQICLSTMGPSPSSEENSLDPNSPCTNSVHVFPGPAVRIVGFKLPGPPHQAGYEVSRLSSRRRLVSTLLQFMIHPNCTPLFKFELRWWSRWLHEAERFAKPLNCAYKIQEYF